MIGAKTVSAPQALPRSEDLFGNATAGRHVQTATENAPGSRIALSVMNARNDDSVIKVEGKGTEISRTSFLRLRKMWLGSGDPFSSGIRKEQAMSDQDLHRAKRMIVSKGEFDLVIVLVARRAALLVS